MPSKPQRLERPRESLRNSEPKKRKKLACVDVNKSKTIERRTEWEWRLAKVLEVYLREQEYS